MNKAIALLSGLGLGAGLMYLGDPERGRRRRALLRDKAIRVADATGEAVEVGVRDLGHRAYGAVAEARSRLSFEQVPDDVLVARARARLGRVVSHPRSVEIAARDGVLTLRGFVLEREVERLVEALSEVPGVEEVQNLLQVRERPEDIPALQGQARTPEPRSEFMQQNWAPGIRLAAAIAGGFVSFYGLGRRGALGTLLGAVGGTLLARAVSNMELKRMVGVATGREGVYIQKTLNLNVPVDKVFEFWRDFENFPRFMAHVRDVRDLGEGRSHWVVAGPAGIPVAWDAITTECISNQLIAWRSLEGAQVQTEGTVRFDPNLDGSTRIQIRMSYVPPAGALGHAVATLFGADPKHEMDFDLAVMKSILESGQPVG